MTETLQVFEYEGARVRTVLIDGEAWLVAKDVCDVLGLTNSRMAVQELDEDEKGVSSVYTPGGMQDMTIINEAGLYKLTEPETCCEGVHAMGNARSSAVNPQDRKLHSAEQHRHSRH